MRQPVLPYQDVFFRLKCSNKRMKFEVPSKEDWTLAALIREKLKIFYDNPLYFPKGSTLSLTFFPTYL